MIAQTRSVLVRAFRRSALPLGWYYAVTLAIPIANGAALSVAFGKHALVVLAVPPLAILVVCVVQTIAHAGALRLERCRVPRDGAAEH